MAHHTPPARLSRRNFLHWSAAGAAGSTVAGLPARAFAAGQAAPEPFAPAPFPELDGLTIAQLQQEMAAGRLTARQLVRMYLARIRALDKRGPAINSILELNPDALEIAAMLDAERAMFGPRGPLHGIPILLKDNIDTADRMTNTAGSFALQDSHPPLDSTVAARLRAAGAVLLGKTNLSEWANFRSFHSSSGWCGRGGQGRNPYVLDRNPCGSSSGSGQATAAALAAAALATETDGSIVCPASACGVVGIKPTVGLTSRAGVIPISHTQDTVGPHARSVADAAAVLGALTGVDPRDPATAASAGKFFTDYTQFLDPNGLQGAHIGVARAVYSGYSEETDAIFNAAVQLMSDHGAIVVDPADIPTAQAMRDSLSEIIVLIYEFKRDLNAYLASLGPGAPVHTLAEIIAFNIANASVEMPFFLQEIFELSEADIFTAQDYASALAESHLLSRTQGIDAVMDQLSLDALVAPTGTPAWTTDLINGDHFIGASSDAAARAGYPLITVPAGFSFGLPVGITFMGRAFSEPTLIKIASGFEHVAQVRQPPQFLTTLNLGTPPNASSRLTTGAPVTKTELLSRLSAGRPFRLGVL